MRMRTWIVWVALLMANVVSVRSIGSTELDSMLESLRLRGYDLFCNAIVTSDLQIELANNNSLSFTFFAPTDAALFALDITQTASSYTDTLRFHIVPRRLSLPHLRFLPDGYLLPTLLPNRRLQLTRRPPSNTISVAGVDVAFPGLFYGGDVAVHGLAGILSLRSNDPSPAPLVPPIRSADRRFYSPRSSPNSPENQPPVLGPVPRFVLFNVTNWLGSPPPVGAPAAGSTAVTRRAPAASPVNGIVNAPEREPHWTVLPPVKFGNSPVASPPKYPDSTISLPPEGYSNAAAPSPEVRLHQKVCERRCRINERVNRRRTCWSPAVLCRIRKFGTLITQLMKLNRVANANCVAFLSCLKFPGLFSSKLIVDICTILQVDKNSEECL